MSRRWFGIVAVGLVFVPAVVIAVSLRRLPEPHLAEFEPVDPIVFEPVVVEDDLGRVVDLRLTWEEVPGPVAGGADGIVTAWFAGEGARLGHGEPVYAVSGAVVTAFATPAPVHRSLARGDHGEDVDAVAAALADLGYDVGSHSAGERVDVAMEAAFGDFADDHGLPNRRVFDPRYVVWLPDARVYGDPQPVGRPLWRPGQRAPEVGVDLFEPAPVLRRVELVEPESGGGQPLSIPGAVPSGTASSGAADADAWRVLVEGEVLRIGDLLAGDRDALGTLAGLVDTGAPSISAVVALVEPARWALVPATAVIEGEGTVCVTRPDGSTMPLTVVGGSIGQVMVEPDLPPRVVANPHLVFGAGLRC